MQYVHCPYFSWGWYTILGDKSLPSEPLVIVSSLPAIYVQVYNTWQWHKQQRKQMALFAFTISHEKEIINVQIVHNRLVLLWSLCLKAWMCLAYNVTFLGEVKRLYPNALLYFINESDKFYHKSIPSHPHLLQSTALTNDPQLFYISN